MLLRFFSWVRAFFESVPLLPFPSAVCSYKTGRIGPAGLVLEALRGLDQISPKELHVQFGREDRLWRRYLESLFHVVAGGTFQEEDGGTYVPTPLVKAHARRHLEAVGIEVSYGEGYAFLDGPSVQFPNGQRLSPRVVLRVLN